MKFRLVSVSLALSFLFLITNVSAQESIECSKRCNKSLQLDKIDKLSHHLKLSDEQVKMLKEGFESDMTGKEKKALIDQLLTEEQRTTLAESNPRKGNHKRHHRYSYRNHHRPYNLIHKRMDPEVKDKLVEMRTQLEADISEEDKATLTKLRAEFRALKPKRKTRSEWREKSEEEKLVLKSQWKENRNQLSANRKILHTLKEKYSEAIASLFEENKDFFIDKREERFEKRNDEKSKSNQKADRGRRAGSPIMERKKAWFLLMEADLPTELVEKRDLVQPSKLRITPNPANIHTTLTYELPAEREIKIELRDEQGQFIELIAAERLGAGSYEKSLNTSQLTSRLYLVTLWDGVEMITEKLVIQR